MITSSALITFCRRAMILRQLLHTDPAVAASYLFGCGGRAVGAVIDPVGDPHAYALAASQLGLRIRYVGNPTSTIGFERRYNKAFAIANRDAFVAYMLRDIPPRPPNASRVRAENLGLLQPV